MDIRWQLISLLMKNSKNYETRYKIRRIFESKMKVQKSSVSIPCTFSKCCFQ